jgi:hypothetical protein
MHKLLRLAFVLCAVSCAGLDIEGEVSAEGAAAFREFKTGLYGHVHSARVELSGGRDFSLRNDTDRLDALVESIDAVILLAAQGSSVRMDASAAILLYSADADLYGSVLIELDPDEIRKPILVIQYESWYFVVRSKGLASLARRWLETGS